MAPQPPPSSSRPPHRHRDRDRESSAGRRRSSSAGGAGHHHPQQRRKSNKPPDSSDGSSLSADALARLDRENARRSTAAAATAHEPRRERERERARDRDRERERDRDRERERERDRERERRRDREWEKERDEQRQQRRRASKSRTRNPPVIIAAPDDGDGDGDGDDPRRRDRNRNREGGGYRELDVSDHDRAARTHRDRRKKDQQQQQQSRVVSGAVLEEGREKRGTGLRGGAGSSSYDSLEEKDTAYGKAPGSRWTRKRLFIYIGVGLAALILIIVVAVVVSKKNSSSSSSSNSNNNNDGSSTASGIGSISPSSIPAGAPSWLNPFDWLDTVDFNLTYTDEMVGDLPVMGLNSSWDDSAQANPTVPALNQPWGSYAQRPARGVNIGGWLSIEPFITPSLFAYQADLGIIDEWTLCTYLADKCNATLEQHYSTWVTEATFQEIAAAGLDHVRIPFSYWAVQTYPGDPYVFRTSWRYLLRAIEWARRYGLRVNLDLHGLPGSQNGWNHSGRQGPIGWFNGTDGALNANRSLDVHDRLSTFFAQPRYANIITHYGLANEPRMTFLSVPDVLNWTATAYGIVRANGLTNADVIFGDGFRGLANWQGELQGYSGLVLDVHQYVIFNTNQIVFNHTEKVAYACQGWTQQAQQSMSTATGYGPTMFAEWSQADTDCAPSLNNVGWGNRWTGTYVTGNASLDITTPRCPLTDSQCECSAANAAASQWSDTYKQFLLMFAEAQMTSFEYGLGWWYWVWDTESAPQWSYKQGLAAGILPAKAYDRSFNCSQPIPSFQGLPEYY